MMQPPSDKIFKVTETGNLRLLIDPFSVMSAEGTPFVYGGGFVDVTNNSSGFVVVDSGTGVASVTTDGSDTTKYYLAYVQASQGTSRIVQQFENGPYKQAGVDGGGTVTAVSVVAANGFSGTVATPNSTPAITISMADGTVTLAKMADLAANSVIGNSTGSAATPQTLAAGSVGLSVLATTTQAAARAAIGAGTGSGTVTSVSVVTANGVSGSVATDTTTPAITLTLGAITPTSIELTGTGGNGFVKFLTQSSAPAAPASGFTQFADSSGRFSWIRQSDGFTRSFDVTATANRTFTLPDANFTFAGQNLANTFSVAQVFSANGALSAPAVSFTGTPITGGTTVTTVPLVKVGAGADGGYVTGGTVLGINAPAGFVGDLLYAGVNGTRYLSVNSGGVRAVSSALYGDNGLNLGSLADVTLTRKAAANLQLGAADAAAPVAQTLSVQSVVAGTTDTAGANFIQKMSAGTGTGASGSWILQTAPAALSTASTQNAFVTQLTVPSAGGLQIGSGGSNAPYIFPFSGTSSGSVTPSGLGLSFFSYIVGTVNTDSFSFNGNAQTATSGTSTHVKLVRSFAPTSGTAVYNHLTLTPTINQTGGANGITRGIYVVPTLTSAADFRALEITDGNVVLPKTVTAGGTTGAQTINKITGSVNFAAAATSLVVTNAYVTANSIINCTVASNDTTMKSVAVVAGSGSFTIYANAAATAETRVNFLVTN